MPIAPGDVPVIDIAGAEGPARDRIARQIDDALTRFGFLQIVGHGVPDDVIERMRAACDAFFARELADKLRCLPPDPSVNRGYAPQGTEALSYSLGADAPPDLFEAFNLGPEDMPASVLAHPRAAEFFPDNVWPDDMPDFRAALLEYFVSVRALAHRVTSLFATALGLPEDFFEARTDHSTDVLRVINYERRPSDGPPLPGQNRMGPHADYGIVTVLCADPVPGLEIVAPDGEWRPVVPEPGAFVLNIGDLLAQWTNDRWRSTLHRVVPPSGDGPAKRRSAAFFHDGNHDALVECLSTCCSEDNPPRYAPVLAGDHLAAKVIGPRTLSVSEAVSTAGDRPIR